MTSVNDPNSFWDDVLERFRNRTALVSADGQNISFAKLDRAISNIADILVDYGATPDARVACTIPNFAVTVAFWFATWRLGGHVMTAPNPQHFEQFGLAPDFVLVPSGTHTSVGKAVPVHSKLLIDEHGVQTRSEAGKTYFVTANTPRDIRAMAVSPSQIIQDGLRYNTLLGAPRGGIYMTTGLSSLRAMRDVFRSMHAGVRIIGGDVAPDAAWPLIRETEVRELMLSPLSLHLILKHSNSTDQNHRIDRVFVGAGTATPDLLHRAHAFFAGGITLGAGTNETSVYAVKDFNPETYRKGQIGQTCCGIVGEVRDANGTPVANDQVGQLALWVPKDQRFEGYVKAASAYDEDGWVFPGFLAKMTADGEITKLGRTDDRINLGGTRLFSGKLEAQLERLPSVRRAAAIRVYAPDGAEALGVAIEPGEAFHADSLHQSMSRSLRGIGEIFVKPMSQLPTDAEGNLDRQELELVWPTLPTTLDTN